MSDLISDTQRWRTTAATWFGNATHRIRFLGQHENENVRAVASWEAARLLGSVLMDARCLATTLDDDSVEDVERVAKELVAALRAHRLAGKLRQTSGRTPEEADAFARKADELAGRRA